jgi:hypothetical protein
MNPKRANSAMPALIRAASAGEDGANTATRQPGTSAFGFCGDREELAGEMLEAARVIRDCPRAE